MDVKSVFPSIPEWFSGKSILITGATGFMGKVLVEKLLRDCPDVSQLYLLIRPKRGAEPAQRREDYINHFVSKLNFYSFFLVRVSAVGFFGLY